MYVTSLAETPTIPIIFSLNFVSLGVSLEKWVLSRIKLTSYLFEGLKYGAFETIARTVPGYVAPYLQVLGIVRHIEYPTIHRDVRYTVSVVLFCFHQKYSQKMLLSFAKYFRFLYLLKLSRRIRKNPYL